MKNLSFFNKIMYTINIVFVVGLIFCFFAPYLPPQKFGIISLVSLTVPILICVNLLFLIYWILVGFKRQLFPTAIVLILSLFFIPSLYKFSGETIEADTEFSIMSYNVRKFNKFQWIKFKNIDIEISKFIHSENPDIVALQEYQNNRTFKLNYPFISNPLNNNYSDPVMNQKFRSHLALFSKYPIINEGVIKYHKTYHSVTFADIVKNNDTIRVYNFHLASLGVIPNEDFFGHSDSKSLLKRLSHSFKLQQIQINAFKEHIKNCNYKVILVGDMNNTAYSWIYKHTKNDLKDTFLETGEGFGKTYNFKGFPLRIDYIFVDKGIKVQQHKNYTVKYSDHFPIMATVSF